MTVGKLTTRQFLVRLIIARDAVRYKNTGCSTAPDKCYYCALTKRASVQVGQFRLEGDLGSLPAPHWSLWKPREHTLLMFDNSIAALEKELGLEFKKAA
jgi:hypothetical protein